MTWVWTGLMLAAVVAVGICRWQDWRRARTELQAQHEEWIRQILGSDREISEMEAMARRVVREHEGRP